jgi:hypothetical protein
VAELVDALGSGSSVLWTWEFESPLRHQPKPKFSRLYLEKSPQRLSRKKGQIAQLVEQRTENPCVGGSIPPLATNKINDFFVSTSCSLCLGVYIGGHGSDFSLLFFQQFNTLHLILGDQIVTLESTVGFVARCLFDNKMIITSESKIIDCSM